MIKLILKLIISVLVIIAAYCFFIYPAVITTKTVFSAPDKVVSLSWFRKTSKRFDKWGKNYLKIQYAKNLYHANVAATEWPMFGSVFYLLTAEEIQIELRGRNNSEAEKTKIILLAASETAAKIVVDPVTASWVRKKWGESYLEKENLFYRMLVIMGLSSYEKITGNKTYRKFLREQTVSLGQELLEAKYHVLDDYPDECYPNDILWAVAAILRADKLLGTDHSILKNKLMKVLNSRSLAEEGLPAYFIEDETAAAITPARGCGNSGTLIFAPELNLEIAEKWYKKHEEIFWQSNFFAVGFREFSRKYGNSYSDVDSGIVIGGFGSVASAFGIGAARVLGRLDHAIPLEQQAVAVSWPTPFGFIMPSLLGKIAADAPCLGEIALLFVLTRPALVSETTPFSGKTPWLVWTLILIYSGVGSVLILGRVKAIIEICKKTFL